MKDLFGTTAPKDFNTVSDALLEDQGKLIYLGVIDSKQQVGTAKGKQN
jgi:hypothetical protein